MIYLTSVIFAFVPQNVTNFGVSALSQSLSSNVAKNEELRLESIELEERTWEDKDKNLLVIYSAQDGLGMRTNRHFYPPNNELVFIDGLSHIEETASRHQKRILLWQESLLQTYLSFPF